MILIEAPTRIVTVAWDKVTMGAAGPGPYLAITAIRPDEDPSKVQVKVIRLAAADCKKLAEFILASPAVQALAVEGELQTT